MNAVDFIDHIPQEITVNHPIEGSPEDSRNNIAPVTLFACAFK